MTQTTLVEKKEKPSIIKETDTGDIWECPICGEQYHLIHREVVSGKMKIRTKHKLEKRITCSHASE